MLNSYYYYLKIVIIPFEYSMLEVIKLINLVFDLNLLIVYDF